MLNRLARVRIDNFARSPRIFPRGKKLQLYGMEMLSLMLRYLLLVTFRYFRNAGLRRDISGKTPLGTVNEMPSRRPMPMPTESEEIVRADEEPSSSVRCFGDAEYPYTDEVRSERETAGSMSRPDIYGNTVARDWHNGSWIQASGGPSPLFSFDR